MVSNDFGSVETGEIIVNVNTTWSTDGLVGWWKFDEGAERLHMIRVEMAMMVTRRMDTWTNGKIGGAISLDGTNDYVEISSRKWNIENLFSVSFWYLNNGTNGTIFFLGISPYNNEILLWIL